MANNQKRHVPGISVYPRGKKWAYLVTGPADIVTGKQPRDYKGGFETDEEAWDSALKRKGELDAGRAVKITTASVEKYFREWLGAVRTSVKPSTYANYRTNVEAYVLPAVGHRPLRELSVPVLNALYVRLSESGRVAGDGNFKMHEYWLANRAKRDGRGPGPTEISTACGTSYHAARKAVGRFQHGRVPAAYSAGLGRKALRNIHRIVHRALKDAVAWQYLDFNPAEHASLPRVRRGTADRPSPWTLAELAQWLRLAQEDRFAGLWVLAATTGMRRSELAGVCEESLDLDAGTLEVLNTRVVVDGRAEDEDGKTDAGRRVVALDAFTVAALRKHVEMLRLERREFGKAYPDHGALAAWPDGKRVHPQTITNRFNNLVDRAGARRIRLHDIRHTYATLALDSGVEPKILSDRVGHSNMNVTFQIYAHRSTGQDRAAAELIGTLIAEAIGEPEPPRETA